MLCMYRGYRSQRIYPKVAGPAQRPLRRCCRYVAICRVPFTRTSYPITQHLFLWPSLAAETERRYAQNAWNGSTRASDRDKIMLSSLSRHIISQYRVSLTLFQAVFVLGARGAHTFGSSICLFFSCFTPASTPQCID